MGEKTWEVHPGGSSHFYFMLTFLLDSLSCRPEFSALPIHPQMKSALRTEGAVDSCRNRKREEENPA